MEKTDIIKVFFHGKGYDLKKIKGYSDNAVIINKALNKQEALEALELYYNLKIPVLGGDVFYLKDNDEIVWTDDNWYVNQQENETDIQFLNRSIEESQNYINNYNNLFKKDCIFLFDIVCREI